MRDYDMFVFGNLSIGIIKTPAGDHVIPGGPVLFASWTAHQLGYSVGLLTKSTIEDKSHLDGFPMDGQDIYWRESSETTSNQVLYHTESMETRISSNLGRAGSFRIDEFPEISAKVIQYCGLIIGEIDLEFIRFISRKAPIALDAQGLVSKVFPDRSIEYVDWDDKFEALPLVSYFKADAAEAAILTGIQTDGHEGRVAAGKKLAGWGAKEVVVSHHEGLIGVIGSDVVFSPFRNRNLSGRTGRGDTSFTTYIAERSTKDPADAIQYAAALTSIKMEDPGPFKKTRQEVEVFKKKFF